MKDRFIAACASSICMFSLMSSSSAQTAGDPSRGMQLYIARCGACHSMDDHGAGPRRRHLMGRQAGSEPGYDYSPALQQSKIVWSTETLNRWLTNPNELVPGNKMVVQLANDPIDRADIIAYLATGTR